MTEVATIAPLRALRGDDGVLLERTWPSGRIERWRLEPTDTLRARDGRLTLVSRCGSSSAIAQFDGVPDELEAFVNAVANAAGCSARIG